MRPAVNIPLYDIKVSRAAIAETVATLKSGWLTSGPKVAAFEKAIAERSGVKQAAAVSSATAGLQIALHLLRLPAGAEVITTPHSFIATTASILYAGLIPVYCDIDPDTLNIDTAQIARKITRKTRLVLPVDIAGHPCDYTAMRSICKDKGINILSDSAHAFGALYRGKPIPHWTDLSVFSFHATKNLTSGEGGAVVARDARLVERARILARHGINRDAYLRKQANRWEYDINELGLKANMSDVLASVGLGELTQFDRNQMKREKIAARYAKNLRHLADYVELPVTRPNCRHAWHLYITKLQTSRVTITRNQFVKAMAKRGVECGVHYIPIPNFTVFSPHRLSPRQFPVAHDLAGRVVSLPMYASLKLSQVDLVCEAVETVIRRHIKRPR
jgi:dTDP-4-amino-4,6-dideoxygalactose transaminase